MTGVMPFNGRVQHKPPRRDALAYPGASLGDPRRLSAQRMLGLRVDQCLKRESFRAVHGPAASSAFRLGDRIGFRCGRRMEPPMPRCRTPSLSAPTSPDLAKATRSIRVIGTAFTNNQTYFQGFPRWLDSRLANPAPNKVSADYIPGPAYLNNWSPSLQAQLLIDRYGVTPSASASLNDGAAQQASNASALLGGAPVGSVNMYKNGTGFQNEFYGGVTQTQTIAIGDGSTSTFSSGIGFGGSIGVALASTVTGSISGNTMTIPAPGPGLIITSTSAAGVSCGSCAAGTVITGYGDGHRR